jgi:glycine/D-amino acid oxidase-like deaminating enzyme
MLLREAGQQVVVLEARSVGSGASGRNAGHCIAWPRGDYHDVVAKLGRPVARDLRRLTESGRATVRAWLERFGLPFEGRGSQCLGIDAAEGAELREAADALVADGFHADFSDRDPFDAGFHGRLHQPHDLALDPWQLVRRLMAESGAVVHEHAPVESLEQSEGGVVVRAARITVTCGRAIIATDARSATLHPYFRDRLMPVRGQMYATEPSREPRIVDMPTGTDHGYIYFRQPIDGRLLIGGLRNRFMGEEVGFDDGTTPHLQGALESWVRSRFPSLGVLRVTHRWAGTMGFSRDGLPLIGRLPDMPHVSFVVGFGGSGMSYGPACARLAVEYLLTDAHPGFLHAARLD